MDEVFRELGSDTLDLLNDDADEDNMNECDANFSNEVKEAVTVCNRSPNKRKEMSVKPISPADEKEIDSAIEMAKSIATKVISLETREDTSVASKKRFPFKFPIRSSSVRIEPKPESRTFRWAILWFCLKRRFDDLCELEKPTAFANPRSSFSHVLYFSFVIQNSVCNLYTYLKKDFQNKTLFIDVTDKYFWHLSIDLFGILFLTFFSLLYRSETTQSTSSLSFEKCVTPEAKEAYSTIIEKGQGLTNSSDKVDAASDEEENVETNPLRMLRAGGSVAFLRGKVRGNKFVTPASISRPVTSNNNNQRPNLGTPPPVPKFEK